MAQTRFPKPNAVAPCERGAGEMALRWTAAGMLEAERQFRKIIGYCDLATLVIAIERDYDLRRTHADAARTFRPAYYSPERAMSSPAI